MYRKSQDILQWMNLYPIYLKKLWIRPALKKTMRTCSRDFKDWGIYRKWQPS